MDKRKIFDYIFIGFVLLVLAGSVSGCGESEKEPQADIESIHSEPGKRIIETDTKTVEVCTDTSENGGDDTDYVFYLEDEGVRNNLVFAAFIDKKIPAYDLEIGENRYIYECKEYCEYYKYGLVPPVFGLHYMVEDLDVDGEDELLVFLQWSDTVGDLLVFHEKDGKLYQWETWEDFLWMRMMDIEYYGNGIFSQGGGAGDIFGYYNAEGKIEYIVDFSAWWEQEGEEWLPKSRLVLYKDGIEDKKLEYEGTHYWLEDTWGEITPENQAIKDECAAIMNGIREELGEGRPINGLGWNEDAKKIPLNELLKSNKDDEKNTEEVEYPSEEEIAALGIPEDMLAYWLVLNNKKPFISVNQEGQKFFWNEYFWDITWLCDEYSAYCFMIVDMDRDGGEEIVLACDPGTTHILRYEDGEVYGYQFGVRSMLTISEDGIFDASGGVVDNYFYRLTELNKGGYTEELLAEQDGEHYEIGGKEVMWEEFYEYAENIFARQTERIDFTESMLKGHLLGDLSEQELALVKRIPAENMLESEPDYQEHKQALQLYAVVLKGEQDVILATEDTFKFADETLPIYFSLVDMDRDGVLELVFTCYFDVVWVLHYEAGEVYGYHLRDTDTLVITTDGVFRTKVNLSPTGYARITAFEEDGFQIEPVEDYKSGSHERIRYYYFSEEAIAKWLE